MFTNRNKLSALALGTLLSISALQPVLAAEEAKEDAKMARDSQQNGDAPCADSKKQVNDKANMKDSAPEDWYQHELRIPHG